MVGPARVRLFCIAIAFGLAPLVAAGQEAGAVTTSASIEHVRAALQSTPFTMDPSLFTPAPPHGFRLGPLELVPPETPGQFVAIRLPIGALSSRAAQSLAIAQHRRAENATQRQVTQVVADLQKAHPR